MVTPASSVRGKRGNASTHFFLFCGSQPPPLRGTSFQRKEGNTRMPLFPILSFRAKARNLFRSRSGKRCEERNYGKHRTCLLVRSGSQPLPLRGTSFQRKEGDTRMPLSPWGHFERKREIFFVRGQKSAVRRGITGNIAHAFSVRSGSQPPLLWGTSFQRKEGDTRMLPKGCP